MPQRIEYNGEVHEFPDDFTDADISAALQEIDATATTPPAEMQSSGVPTMVAGIVQSVPKAVQGAARFAANHAAATQKTIGAGITAAASGVGGAIGGIPGAVGGGMIRGVTPSQAVIREVAGRMAGETPHVAGNAARSIMTQNYGKELGLRLKPSDLITRPVVPPALDSFAESMGQKIHRLYGPAGEIISGPDALVEMSKPKPPSPLVRAASTANKVLSPLTAATAVTDFAQTVEPTRRDIGVAGIGASVPDLPPDEVDRLNARNIAAMEQRLQQPSVIDLILRYLQSR